MGIKGSPVKNFENSDIMDTSGIKALNASAMREMINNYGMSSNELNDVRMNISHTLDA